MILLLDRGRTRDWRMNKKKILRGRGGIFGNSGWVCIKPAPRGAASFWGLFASAPEETFCPFCCQVRGWVTGWLSNIPSPVGVGLFRVFGFRNSLGVAGFPPPAWVQTLPSLARQGSTPTTIPFWGSNGKILRTTFRVHMRKTDRATLSPQSHGPQMPPPPCPGMHWKGAGYPPPPFRASCLCPATVSLTASASLDDICNRR